MVLDPSQRRCKSSRIPGRGTPIYNLRTKTGDAEGRTTTVEYRDPAAGKPWVIKQITGAGTPEAASTTNTYYENTTEPWRYGNRKTMTMPKGNASGCDSACATDYTTTYDYWGPSDTYSFPGDSALSGMPQQGWVKSTSKPGDTPVSCAGQAATECTHYDRRGNVVHTLDAHGDHYSVYDLDNRLTKSESRGREFMIAVLLSWDNEVGLSS